METDPLSTVLIIIYLAIFMIDRCFACQEVMLFHASMKRMTF